MKTQRVCAFFSSSVTDELLAPFKKAGLLVNSGTLSHTPLINHLEFNALAFEAEGVRLLKEFSRKEKVLLFWAYNDDLDMDIDSAGMHKGYGHSWGFNLFENAQIQSSLIVKDNWPSYGEGLRKSLDEALSDFNVIAFDGFLGLGKTAVTALQEMFDNEHLFKGFDTAEMDQFLLRDSFLKVIQVNIQ